MYKFFQQRHSDHYRIIFVFLLCFFRKPIARLLDAANAFSHISQTYGFCPECVRMCLVMPLGCANALTLKRGRST